MRTSLVEEILSEQLDREEAEREKAQAIAMETLKRYQNDGLTEREVSLATHWAKVFADDAIKLNRAKTCFSLPET